MFFMFNFFLFEFFEMIYLLFFFLGERKLFFVCSSLEWLIIISGIVGSVWC